MKMVIEGLGQGMGTSLLERTEISPMSMVMCNRKGILSSLSHGQLSKEAFLLCRLTWFLDLSALVVWKAKKIVIKWENAVRNGSSTCSDLHQNADAHQQDMSLAVNSSLQSINRGQHHQLYLFISLSISLSLTWAPFPPLITLKQLSFNFTWVWPPSSR